MQSDPSDAMTKPPAGTKRPEVPAVEVANELRQPLEGLARTLGQAPARIVNQALAEYLERQMRPDRRNGGSTASYIEMTAREDRTTSFSYLLARASSLTL
jgi:hypothetical protein